MHTYTYIHVYIYIYIYSNIVMKKADKGSFVVIWDRVTI